MKIKHLLSEDEKISAFNNEADFIKFVKLIAKENYDDDGFFIFDTVEQCKDYIKTYCDNLELIE